MGRGRGRGRRRGCDRGGSSHPAAATDSGGGGGEFVSSAGQVASITFSRSAAAQSLLLDVSLALSACPSTPSCSSRSLSIILRPYHQLPLTNQVCSPRPPTTEIFSTQIAFNGSPLKVVRRSSFLFSSDLPGSLCCGLGVFPCLLSPPPPLLHPWKILAEPPRCDRKMLVFLPPQVYFCRFSPYFGNREGFQSFHTVRRGTCSVFGGQPQLVLVGLRSVFLESLQPVF